jgi:peptide/nickel transport system substrate-binding protein
VSQAQCDRWCWAGSAMRSEALRNATRRYGRKLPYLAVLVSLLTLSACRSAPDHSHSVVVLIESSPNNLDLRQGTDAQSERIGELIYDPLVRKDAQFNLQPWLATSWERPDPLTWIFHLRSGVHFHDGHLLTADDVAWSLHSMIDGSLITAKGGAFALVKAIDVLDASTLVVHTSQPNASLLFNLSDGLFGVVERGAGRDEGLHPVGTGPFRFVSQVQDKEVVVERNPGYWGGEPSIQRVRFTVVPDTITAALAMRKAARTGEATVESNVLTLDMVHALRDTPGLRVQSSPGARVDYMNFNLTVPALRDERVRQAIACALDKQAIIAALWRGRARPAETLLPPGHWAAAPVSALAQYPRDIPRAKRLLDAAGFKPDKRGIRLRLTMKTSTDETTRLEAQAMQAELRDAGIELDLRSAEFGTFYADITKGAFEMYMLRWIGSNDDPDIFHYAYASSMAPPKGANRGHFSSERLDALLQTAAGQTDEAARRQEYIEVQQILADELPSIPLWYPDNVIVSTDRIMGIVSPADGSYDFLRSATTR